VLLWARPPLTSGIRSDIQSASGACSISNQGSVVSFYYSCPSCDTEHYCDFSVYHALFVAKDSGATGFDDWPRALPVRRLSLSIIISSHVSIPYLGGFPSFWARFVMLKAVPVTPNIVVTRAKGIKASHGTGMLGENRVRRERLKVLWETWESRVAPESFATNSAWYTEKSQ